MSSSKASSTLRACGPYWVNTSRFLTCSARSRRDSDIGLYGSAILSALVVTFGGGFGAIAVSETRSPFDIATDLTGNEAILAYLCLAVIVQCVGVNVINAYSVGMSLANIFPKAGRVRATAVGAVVGIALPAVPDFLNSAEDWIIHLGNVASPMAGVVMVDYLIVKRQRTVPIVCASRHRSCRLTRAARSRSRHCYRSFT